jgi:RND family efflux transporter MFP subunit
MKIKHLLIVLFGLILTTTFTLGQASDSAKEAEKPKKCPRTVKVLVEKIVPQTFKEFKSLKKRVLPFKEFEVSTQIAGGIKSIEKVVGDKVKKDDVILILDSEKYQKEIEEAKTKIKNWERNLFRRRNWKVRSERAEKQAENILKTAKETLAQAEQNLALCTVTSPADGMLGTMNVNEGDHISSGYIVGNVVKTQKVKLALTEYAAKVTDGKKIKIRIKELSKVFKGTVKKFSEDNAEIIIENSTGEILLGMTARVAVLLKTYPEAIVLNQAQILKDDVSEYVFTVKGKRTLKSVLKTGPKGPKNTILIEEGLAAGNEIIVSEILSAKEGTLHEEFTCLADNKKIKIMEMDPQTSKFKKRKKKVAAVAPVEPKPEVVKPVEPPVKEEKPVVKEEVEKVDKKEPKPTDVETFISFLDKNKYTIKYDKYKKTKHKTYIQVTVYCDEDAKDRLLGVIDSFNFHKYSIVSAPDDEQEKHFHVFFRRGEAEPKIKPEAITRKIKPEAPPTGKLKIGANLSMFMMMNENFKDIYGNMTGLGINVSYFVKENLDILFTGAISSKTAAIDWAEEDLEFKFRAFTLDLRYYFKRSAKLDLLAGAGFNLYPFEEINPIENVKSNAFGFNILGGTSYHINNKFSVDFMLRLNLVRKSKDSLDTVDLDLVMNNLELFLGITYNINI